MSPDWITARDHLYPLVREAREALLTNPDDDLRLRDFEAAPNDTRLLAKVTLGLEDALDCYDGAKEDCRSAVEVLIRRIKGEADLESAREWVRSNYPSLASKHGLLDPVQNAVRVAKQATGEGE